MSTPSKPYVSIKEMREDAKAAWALADAARLEKVFAVGWSASLNVHPPIASQILRLGSVDLSDCIREYKARSVSADGAIWKVVGLIEPKAKFKCV